MLFRSLVSDWTWEHATCREGVWFPSPWNHLLTPGTNFVGAVAWFSKGLHRRFPEARAGCWVSPVSGSSLPSPGGNSPRLSGSPASCLAGPPRIRTCGIPASGVRAHVPQHTVMLTNAKLIGGSRCADCLHSCWLHPVVVRQCPRSRDHVRSSDDGGDAHEALLENSDG